MAFTLNLHPTLPVYIDDKRLQFMHMAHSTHIITWRHCSHVYPWILIFWNEIHGLSLFNTFDLLLTFDLLSALIASADN